MLYRSSSKVKRGFCGKCGTPLSYQHPGGVELAIGAFDHPEQLEPQVQVTWVSTYSGWIPDFMLSSIRARVRGGGEPDRLRLRHCSGDGRIGPSGG